MFDKPSPNYPIKRSSITTIGVQDGRDDSCVVVRLSSSLQFGVTFTNRIVGISIYIFSLIIAMATAQDAPSTNSSIEPALSPNPIVPFANFTEFGNRTMAPSGVYNISGQPSSFVLNKDISPSTFPSIQLSNVSSAPTFRRRPNQAPRPSAPVRTTQPSASSTTFTPIFTPPPTLVPTPFPTSAPTLDKLEELVHPLEMDIFTVDSTFQKASVILWQNITSSFIEDYWNLKNETISVENKDETTIIFPSGQVADAVSDVKVQTRVLFQVRRNFELSGVVPGDGTELETNSTQGLIMLYANHILYRTSNLAYSPEVLVTEPFSTLKNRQDYVALLTRSASSNNFVNVTFVTEPVILQNLPPSLDDFLREDQIVSNLRISMEIMNPMNKTEEFDWRSSMKTHIENYWNDLFFQDPNNRVFNLDVYTDIVSQYSSPPIGSVRQRKLQGIRDISSMTRITVVYNQQLRYNYLGSTIEDEEHGAYILASEPFADEFNQELFITRLQRTGNHAFDLVRIVSTVDYQTDAPTPMPTTSAPTASLSDEEPSASPTSQEISPAEPTKINAAAVVVPVILLFIAATAICYFLIRRARHQREEKQRAATLENERRAQLEEAAAKSSPVKASAVHEVAAQEAFAQEVPAAAKEMVAQDVATEEVAVVNEVAVQEPEESRQNATVDVEFAIATGVPVLDKEKHEDPVADEEIHIENDNAIHIQAPDFLMPPPAFMPSAQNILEDDGTFDFPGGHRRFPTATLDTAFLAASTAMEDTNSMMMTVTPINDYIEEEDFEHDMIQ